MRKEMNKKGGSRFDFLINRKILKSKHSSEMAIGTLVVIVLAIIVLVVLALGFTMGWNSLWNKITPYIGGSGGGSNVDSVKNACKLLCDSAEISPSSKTEYCNNKQTVVVEGQKSSGTCDKLKTQIGLACDVSC